MQLFPCLFNCHRHQEKTHTGYSLLLLPTYFLCVGVQQLGCVHANMCVFMCVSGVERDDECATVKVRKLIWFKFKSDPSSSDRSTNTSGCPHMYTVDFQCPYTEH